MAHSRFNRIDNCDYSLGPNGHIVVHSRSSGETGEFDQFGTYQSGQLKQADVQMCQFIAKLGKHRPNG